MAGVASGGSAASSSDQLSRRAVGPLPAFPTVAAPGPTVLGAGASAPLAPGTADGKPHLMRLEVLYSNTPVVGCDLVPFAVVRTPEGEIKSAEYLEAKTGGQLAVQYSWARQVFKHQCAALKCGKEAALQFAPIAALIPHDAPATHPYYLASFYCSPPCLTTSWQTILRDAQHRLFADAQPAAALSYLTSRDPDVVRRGVRKSGDPCALPALPNPYHTEEVGIGKSYYPSENDVGSRLELTCRYRWVQAAPGAMVSGLPTPTIGPPMQVTTEPVIPMPPPPPPRRFVALPSGELLPDTAADRRTAPPGSFTILTYNILADVYATEKKYEYCPNWALAWTYRKHSLLREIQRYDSDILCLQEVQEDHFKTHMQPALERMGYVGLYKAKTREHMGKKGRMDGCATFWKKDRFSMREHHHIEYNAAARAQFDQASAAANSRGGSNRNTLTRLLKGNVATLVHLDCLDGHGQLLVANTHIFWDPEQSEVKLHQVDVFLQELENFVSRVGGHVPLVIGGDFNSEPTSVVYELIATGSVLSENLEMVDDPEGILESIRCVHNLELRSAYRGYGDYRGKEEPHTNFTPDYTGTLDYLWYKPDGLVMTSILAIPNDDNLLKIDAAKHLPNTRWSSDHVALMAEFQILGYGQRQ